MVERLFGTNGVRGVINKDMNVQLAMDMGRAIGTFMGGKVAVGYDSRTSATMVRSALSAGLMSTGAEVLDLGSFQRQRYNITLRTITCQGGS